MAGVSVVGTGDSKAGGAGGIAAVSCCSNSGLAALEPVKSTISRKLGTRDIAPVFKPFMLGLENACGFATNKAFIIRSLPILAMELGRHEVDYPKVLIAHRDTGRMAVVV